MTFIPHEDFILDLRYNIHAAKLHFFCVRLLKSSNRIAKGARLWITSVAKVAWIVVWNYQLLKAKQLSSDTMIYAHTEMHVVLWSLLHFYNLWGSLWSTAASLLPYGFYFKRLQVKYKEVRSLQNCKCKRKLDSDVPQSYKPTKWIVYCMSSWDIYCMRMLKKNSDGFVLQHWYRL